MHHRVCNGHYTPASEGGIYQLFRKGEKRKLDMHHTNFTLPASEIEIEEINVSYLIHCPTESTLIYGADLWNKTLSKKCS